MLLLSKLFLISQVLVFFLIDTGQFLSDLSSHNVILQQCTQSEMKNFLFFKIQHFRKLTLTVKTVIAKSVCTSIWKKNKRQLEWILSKAAWILSDKFFKTGIYHIFFAGICQNILKSHSWKHFFIIVFTFSTSCHSYPRIIKA